jgi:diadenosine tetraphosphatase ApaH/serine/threonine PP2A family protein phosphatase
MRIAVVSDIHSNLAALEAVFADADAQGTGAIWCLGDLVGYGPDPNECVALVRERAQVCLGGNHDLAALGEMDLEYFNPDAAIAARWTADQLSDDIRTYLSGLPNALVQDAFTLAHGSPRQPVWEYVLSYGVALASFALLETRYALVGHTHWPTVWLQPAGSAHELECVPLDPADPFPLGEDLLILNPGSVGQPRDGDIRASYLILDTDDRIATVRRVPYALETTQERMREAGLPVRLIERLAVGW